MNWKLFIGQAIDKAENLLINSRLSFVKKNYPYRRNCIFDLKRTIGDANVILDVGAYVGDVAIQFSKWFPSAKIFAFEPINESFDKLQQSTKRFKNISSFNIALGDKFETLEIPVYNSATINTLKEACYDEIAQSTQKVTVLRLDNFLSEQKITGVIDILKIDVEGYELEVLKGMGDYLKKVRYIVTEVGYQRTATKTHFSDMDIFMEKNDFEIFNIYELSPIYNVRTKLHYSNNVYMNKHQL
ncbi:FkbM family methyltransferase [Mucilaginibacter sp. 14171R-50]|uniref:FkbM family methyltransferase n=1 Tax=Mucilaginibacter sp. 14171R-50 TaxID=2703789 RepID=UPI00138C257D|nr:FkbM family methyltransferase [Mucilaginibacter sp. 14171R-50]QHS56056.1 FkbM family methyltransferase [Mucilaginibacter sp. 14171R-50]